jgi:hypothetical protein
VLFTLEATFQQDRPATATAVPGASLTGEGAQVIESARFLLGGDPTLRVRLIGHASAEGAPPHNQALSERRARLVYRMFEQAGLAGQVLDPLQSDGKEAGCQRLDTGVWACGEAKADQTAIHPEDRKVQITFLRNPSILPLLPPLRLTVPSPGGPFGTPEMGEGSP